VNGQIHSIQSSSLLAVVTDFKFDHSVIGPMNSYPTLLPFDRRQDSAARSDRSDPTGLQLSTRWRELKARLQCEQVVSGAGQEEGAGGSE
jgi:hypothetical protein